MIQDKGTEGEKVKVKIKVEEEKSMGQGARGGREQGTEDGVVERLSESLFIGYSGEY